MSPEEKRERLLEAASAVLQYADDNQLNTVCLNKAIFYLDLVSLRDCGHTVTNASFIALEQGPVVAKYPDRLIGELDKAGIAIQEQNGNAKPVRLLNPVQDYHFIKPQILPTIEAIAKKFSGNVSTKASDISHKNPGWKIAFRNGLGAKSRPRPINLLIAMQQIADADPWMSQPLTEEEQLAVQSADHEKGETW